MISTPLTPAASKNTDVQRIKQIADVTSGNKIAQFESGKVVGDKITISEEARQLQKATNGLQQKLEKMPDVRIDKIEAAVQRIKEGYYLSDEVAGKIADSLISRGKYTSGSESINPETKVETMEINDKKSFSAALMKKAANLYKNN